jgi:hypothetical protein
MLSLVRMIEADGPVLAVTVRDGGDFRIQAVERRP